MSCSLAMTGVCLRVYGGKKGMMTSSKATTIGTMTTTVTTTVTTRNQPVSGHMHALEKTKKQNK